MKASALKRASMERLRAIEEKLIMRKIVNRNSIEMYTNLVNFMVPYGFCP